MQLEELIPPGQVVMRGRINPEGRWNPTSFDVVHICQASRPSDSCDGAIEYSTTAMASLSAIVWHTAICIDLQCITICSTVLDVGLYNMYNALQCNAVQYHMQYNALQ